MLSWTFRVALLALCSLVQQAQAASVPGEPEWPQAAKAPPGAPNVVIILLDDIGFADTSTFGGIAQTPELERLAAVGLRYNNFNTASMCSPTRAALLSGRNHHRVGFGRAEHALGYPGYNFTWKKNTASVAEILRRNGYSTSVFGKWHNTPYAEVSPVGPFDRWPTGLGFEYFYGFIAGQDNQWSPSTLHRNTTAVVAPASARQGYHFTTDMTDEAIRWVRTHASLAPEKPYFLYFAPGAVHVPHHAPREWIGKYRGQFDRGWDRLRGEIFARQKRLGVIPRDARLTPRPSEVPAWDSLSADQQRLYARQMEVYAGFIEHTDHEIGRLIRAVQELPDADNTLILYIVGDNGPAALGTTGGTDYRTSVEDQLPRLDELGGPLVSFNTYATGWAWMGSTPFQWWKQVASHFGGTRAPLVASWPARIKDKGAVRSEFTHVVDVAATLYDVTGISFPTVVDGIDQQPLDGPSFASSFEKAGERSPRRTQYFEMMGSRAIYRDGWIAAARHVVRSLEDADYNDRWELYNVDEDFSEANDLAARYPDKLEKLRELFDVEARANDVYPLNGIFGRTVPSLTDNKREFVYYAGLPRLQKRAMPVLAGRPYHLAANVVIPESGAEGVIISYGERQSGFVLYIKEGRLFYENLPLNGPRTLIESSVDLPHGPATLEFDFAPQSTSSGVGWSAATSTGIGRLRINGALAGEARLTMTLGAMYSESMGIGEVFGSSVSSAFEPPFRFTGRVEKLTIQLQEPSGPK